MILEQGLSIPVMHFLKDIMYSRDLDSPTSGGHKVLEQEDDAYCPSPCTEPLPWIFLHHQR